MASRKEIDHELQKKYPDIWQALVRRRIKPFESHNVKPQQENKTDNFTLRIKVMDGKNLEKEATTAGMQARILQDLIDAHKNPEENLNGKLSIAALHKRYFPEDSSTTQQAINNRIYALNRYFRKNGIKNLVQNDSSSKSQPIGEIWLRDDLIYEVVSTEDNT